MSIHLLKKKSTFKWRLVCKSGEVENDMWIFCSCLDMHTDTFQRFVVIQKCLILIRLIFPCQTAVVILFNHIADTSKKIKKAISLTHWGRVTHICVGKLTIIGSDNGLSPEWHQTIIWTNAGIFWALRNKLQWNFNRYSNIFIQENAFGNVVCEMASILSRHQCVNR